MAGYFMMLLWAATFGNVCDTLSENTMIEEWLICIQLYIVIALAAMLKRKIDIAHMTAEQKDTLNDISRR